MATRVFTGFRLFQDSGAVCTDGAIAFYEAGTTTPFTVYSDRALSSSLGASVSLGSLGIAPDIWVADTSSVKAVITGTGVTQDTIDYLTVAASTATGATGADVALGNGLANGAFETWTAGSSFSNISGAGTGVVVADAWYFTQPTAASNAVSRQTALGGQARYGLRFGRPAASTSTNELRIWQTLATGEAYRYRGQAITVSVRVTAGANFSATGLKVRLATGTAEGEGGDNIAASSFTGHASPIDVTQTISTSTTRFEFTATLSSSLKEIGLQFSYVPVGTAGAADYVQIEDVQIEIGSAASTFKFFSEALDYIRNSLTAGGRTLLSLTLGSGVSTWLTTPSSANLKTAITDETGSGSLVFATSPTLVTPVLGVATATSVNKVALTAPATGSTLTIAEGKTLTASNTLTLTATDGSTLAIGTGGTLASAAYKATGTSGNTVPLLDGANTWSAAQTVSYASPILTINSASAAQLVQIRGRANAVTRFAINLDDGAGDFSIYKYNDSGSLVSAPFAIARATGAATFEGALTAGGAFKARTIVSTDTGGTLTTASQNATVLLATAPTIPASTFTAGDEILLYNNTGSSMTVTQGGGGTQRKSGTATTGNLTLPVRGSAPVYFISATEWVIGGVS